MAVSSKDCFAPMTIEARSDIEGCNYLEGYAMTGGGNAQKIPVVMQNPEAEPSSLRGFRTNTTKMLGSTQTIHRFYEILILLYGPVGQDQKNDRKYRNQHPNTLLQD
jgi:hypothetical protein